MKTGKTVTIDKGDVLQFSKNITDKVASYSVDPARVFAYRVSEVLPKLKNAGQVAAIDFNTIYCNLGSEDGIEIDDELIVYRGGTEIIDPETGKILGTTRKKVAEIKVFEVNKSLSKTNVVSDIEVVLKIGDIVELKRSSNAVSVFPIVTTQGQLTQSGVRLTDSVSASLVDLGVNVVERRKLIEVVTELAVQNTVLFDEKTSQSVGKLVGAYAVVTGNLIPRRGGSAEVTLKLVEVKTGRVLCASILRMSRVDSSAVDLKSLFSNQSSDEHFNLKSNDKIIASRAVDLIPLVHPVEDAFRPSKQWKDQFTKINGVLRSSTKPSRIAFPVSIKGDTYRLVAKLRRVQGNGSFMFSIPVQNSHCYLFLSQEFGQKHNLYIIKGASESDDKIKTEFFPGTITNGKLSTIEISVGKAGKDATIDAKIDGKLILHWSGSPNQISGDGNWTPRNSSQPSFGSTHCSVEILSLHLYANKKDYALLR